MLIIRWDIWEVWNENLGKALTHLLGNCRQSRRGTSWKKMVGIMGAVGVVGMVGEPPNPRRGTSRKKIVEVVGALSTLGKDRKKLNYFF